MITEIVQHCTRCPNEAGLSLIGEEWLCAKCWADLAQQEELAAEEEQERRREDRLRDRFAGQALAGLTGPIITGIGAHQMPSREKLADTARTAYAFADAMLDERRRRRAKKQ